MTIKSIGRNTKNTKSVLNQLIDFVEEDISGSSDGLTRKKYKVFVTGGQGPGVTSSIFQTVFDQDHTLQTSNEIFDMTFGLFSGSNIVIASSSGTDKNGKRLFPSHSLMMREKVNVYSQFAQLLLGNSTSKFTAPFSNPSADGSDDINAALFLTFKRLFVRDSIKRETFAMRFVRSGTGTNTGLVHTLGQHGQTNIDRFTNSGSSIFTDVGSATSQEQSQAGGAVGNLVSSTNTNEKVGLVFYNQGVVVLDLEKAMSGTQHVSGTIDAISPTGKVKIGDAKEGNAAAKFIPDFVVSASIDNILDHVASTRFRSGALTAMTFQNNTVINSKLYFCRATADEFNYSSNPTYTDENGRIVVIDENQQGVQKGFAFVTTVGLYDLSRNLLAVAKLSRPVEKNEEKDLTFRVRLDF